MDNLEYLKEIKKFKKTNLDLNTQYRTAKALEIIAEELCKMNNPKYEVTIAKPKIQFKPGCINKTSTTKIKKI